MRGAIRRRARPAAVWISILPKSCWPSGVPDRALIVRWIGAKQRARKSGRHPQTIDTTARDNVIYLDWSDRLRRSES